MIDNQYLPVRSTGPTTVTNPTANQVIARLDSFGLPQKSVFVTSTVAATMRLQVSVDGTNWRSVQTFVLGPGGSAFASSSSQETMRGYRHVRVTSLAVTGDVTAEITAQG